jgi:methionyl-tRNA formyltransferase
MGTPEFAVETLKALVENDYNVVAVVTQPDKPVGRHQTEMQPSQVKQYAVAHGLPVLQPEKMKDPVFIEQLRSYNANLQVVVAFRMLPEVVWAMPRFGTFNVHAALLPQYRGAAPINWAVINGETQTGVTTFFLDHDIDTGRIIMQKPFEIKDDYNVENVYDGLMGLGAEIALETIDRILEGDGKVESLPQEEMIPVGTELHPAPKIFKETCEIDWNQEAKKVYDFIRGLSPYPGAWTTLVSPEGKETVLKVYASSKAVGTTEEQAGQLLREKNRLMVATGNGLLNLEEVQLAGKKRMKAIDFLNGFRDLTGYCVR